MFTEIEPYRNLFDPERWNDLILNFRQENYRLFQLAPQSVLSMVFQVFILNFITTFDNVY